MSNTQSLSKSAQTIQNILSKHGLSFKVVELSATTRTAKDAALAIGCTVAQITKSLIFRVIDEERPIIVLVSGKNLVDEKVIEKSLGLKIVKADATFAKEATGFAIGGIPPIGLKPIETLIDKDLLEFEVLWAAAGTPHAVFSLTPSDLVRITNGKVIAVK